MPTAATTAIRALAPLFASHPPFLRAGIDAVLEGRLGRASAAPRGEPRAARLSIGCYDFFGGEPDPEAARLLTEGLTAPRELVTGNDPAWHGRLRRTFGDRLTERPMQSYDGGGLSSERLRRQAASIPSSVLLARLDETLARQLDGELVPHALQVYPSAGDFARRGVGFGVVVEGRLACAATSYAASARTVEVAIATRPAFRGRGFAEAAAARLLLHCLDEGLEPHWNASNPVSQRLARRLGLRPTGTCEVLYLA